MVPIKHSDKRAVTVNPTNRCNLRCVYCMASSAQEQDHPTYIDVEFAERGIRDALAGYPTGIEARILRFFSPGEPSQYMECVKYCVALARSQAPGIVTEMQTNGLFEEDSDCQWIGENISIVWISLDGPKSINGRNRPDAQGEDRTEQIEENLRYLQQKTFVGVRATVTEETVDHQEELVEYYHALGVKFLYANPVIESVTRKERAGRGAVTKTDMMRFARGFLRGHRHAERVQTYYGCSLTFNFDEPTNVVCRSCLPMPQLNPDGSVSSCDMVNYANAPSELQCFLYGEWNPRSRAIDYDMDKVAYLRGRTLDNLPKCSNCDIRGNCAGGCAGRIAYEKGSPYDAVPGYCAATRFLAANMELNKKGVPTLGAHP